MQLPSHISVFRHPDLWALEHIWRWACELIATFALTANFLPSSKRLYRYPEWQARYDKLITIWAFFALNWRKRLPSAEVLESDSLDREHHIVFREPAE